MLFNFYINRKWDKKIVVLRANTNSTNNTNPTEKIKHHHSNPMMNLIVA